VLDLDTKQITNITKDNFADSGPTWSPDGKYVVYVARVSGNEKLFKVDAASGMKTQLTFGTHDDASAQFVDDDTIVFSSTATDPNQPIDPDVARNGNIYNIWTLSLKNGELRQYTDAVGGNLSPIILRQNDNRSQIAFVSYYKGDYELHALERRDPIITTSTSDFGSPGPIIDFQAPLTHTLIAANKKKKGAFEKLFLDGRPP
jgi:Tol biopolymer transport system component